MHFSNLVAGLALASSVIAAPPTPPGKPGDNCDDSLSKTMQQRGRSFIGTALTIRNETREGEIIKADFNSYVESNILLS